jgi:endonuclease G
MATKSRSNSRVSSRKRSQKSSLSGGVKSLGVTLIIAVIAVIAYMLGTSAMATGDSSATAATTSPKATLGGVTAEQLMEVKNPKGLREEIVAYTGMTVSFNRDTHEPNWVAWELLGSEVTGDSERESSFLTDENVKGCATTDDYRNTGFDRGHMAPAGDMKWHPQAMHESFYLTNICPQAPDLNRGAWNKLEQKCRDRAVADSSLIIICGPIFEKGQPSARIGATGVAVPQSFFKVILAPFVEHPWSIGFVMNNAYVTGGMQKTAVTVDQVEALTGYDFFSALPDSLEDEIESQCNFNSFSRVTKTK